ncbi:INCE protein, partial [Halcyon senegalensis]|nr:INCE protein [Halcyon senegalensis]
AAGAAGPARLPVLCNRRLAEFLQQVEDTELVWLREIREEATRMFSRYRPRSAPGRYRPRPALTRSPSLRSHYRDEPELMPKTPSQKNRPRRKRFSTLREEERELGRKRLSRRRNSSLKMAPSTPYSQRLRNKENLELIRAEAKQDSSPRRVTRSQTAALAKSSESLPEVLPETPPEQQAEGKVPLVAIGLSERISAELHLRKSPPKPAEQLSTTILLSPGGGSPKESGVDTSPVPAPSELMVPHTPEADDAGETEAAPRPKAAKAANITVILSEEPGLEEMDDSAQVPEACEKEPPRRTQDIPATPTSSKRNRRSVRRSLMGKTSMTRRTSLAEKYSLASKRGSMVRKSAARAAGKRRTARKSSSSSSHLDGNSNWLFLCDNWAETNLLFLQNPQSPRMSLRSRTIGRKEQPQETSTKESNLNKNGETQEPPQSARRKPSYKRAVDERYDNQQAEDGGLSPLRKRTPSPAFPASKVVRPFKTFLHTVQKNQLLMTPSSVGRNGVIKSFIRYNTPVQSNPKEKERQKLETLRKKQEAEQLRKQKLEEEKKRRLEEAKLKREERLRKVLQARERAEQIEEERKRRIEQKIALFDEKTEKVREERLAEEKMKKKAAAKKMEEAEARRRHDEEARRQRALQQEEEERRHRELMQKRKEEEQERARKMAEQRQAEQEREKQLAAQRELERKKEQERIQAEKLREQQEKAARLQKEELADQEQLHKEVEEKEQEEQRLAEVQRQEQEQENLPEEQKAKDRAQIEHLENTENSPSCNSDQMTPQGQRESKSSTINPNNYGMDLNSDDSTDDESQPRKPVPAWATGNQLSQAVIRQYYNPPNVDAIFGAIASPKLEDIFYKSKPRYFKRTSSAVWSSPPFSGS